MHVPPVLLSIFYELLKETLCSILRQLFDFKSVNSAYETVRAVTSVPQTGLYSFFDPVEWQSREDRRLGEQSTLLSLRSSRLFYVWCFLFIDELFQLTRVSIAFHMNSFLSIHFLHFHSFPLTNDTKNCVLFYLRLERSKYREKFRLGRNA